MISVCVCVLYPSPVCPLMDSYDLACPPLMNHPVYVQITDRIWKLLSQLRLSPLNCVNNKPYTFPNRSSFSLNEETETKVRLVSVSPIRSGTPGSRACPAGPQQMDARGCFQHFNSAGFLFFSPIMPQWCD